MEKDKPVCFGDRDRVGTPVCAGCAVKDECLQRTIKI